MAPVYRPRDPRSQPYFGVVREHANTFFDVLSDSGVDLPKHVRRRLLGYLGCGDLGRGFLRTRCMDCARERLVPYSCKGRAVCPSCTAKRSAAQTAHLIDAVLPDVPLRQWVLTLPFEIRRVFSVKSELHGPVNRIFIEEIARYYGHDAKTRWSGAVSFLQRFGAALNLHVHSHVLAFDGVFTEEGETLMFEPAPPPSAEAVLEVSSRVAERVAAYFIREGVIDGEGLIQDGDVTPMSEGPAPKSGWLLADGEAVESMPPRGSPSTSAAEYRGFSVHAGVAIAAHDAAGRERLVRYVSRPPFAEQQVQVTRDGRVAFRLGHRKPTGETHVFLHPLAFLRRVTSQIPPLGMNMVRYHGILAPAAKRRREVVRTSPPKTSPSDVSAGPAFASNLSWASLLKRVFDVDALKCPDCGAQMRILAAIEDPDVIDRILTHLGIDGTPVEPAPSRAGDLLTPSYADTG